MTIYPTQAKRDALKIVQKRAEEFEGTLIFTRDTHSIKATGTIGALARTAHLKLPGLNSPMTEKKRYSLVLHAISLMKRSGRIHTRSYGEENLPKEGGYVMYPK